MSQPSFVPVAQGGEVRPTVATATPEIGRKKKPGLLGAPHAPRGRGQGTPAPGEGYALTLAHRACDEMTFASPHDRADVECVLGLVAAKRASLINRGPVIDDVRVARDVLGLNGEVVTHEVARRFAGLAHSYEAQRRFVDTIADADLLVASIGQ
ncbi:MAG: hypothetical protein KGJ10_04440 [Acidobacteriota bacterium]|nr:hypothetical protein [Acidobacteriota bacterium]MDE3044057.1 hypothetical protein [Acidobacteriota bacterium]MDE3222848.1 hypothetical protein [Acidobacteriota bacterium]